jgi:gamma-glutamylcyclotransferase (GGCT)/AIG2-like uncharacterized protein YtfP
MNVFVYGTLKKDGGNDSLLRDAKFLGEAASYEHYALYDGGFPYAVHKDNLTYTKPLQILGEVYEINKDILQSLDWLEGEGKHYFRFKRRFFTKKGDFIEAFIYEYPREMDRPLCPAIELAGEHYYRWA